VIGQSLNGTAKQGTVMYRMIAHGNMIKVLAIRFGCDISLGT